MIIVIGMSKTIINMNIQKPTTTNLLKLRSVDVIDLRSGIRSSLFLSARQGANIVPKHFIKQDRNGSFAAKFSDRITEIRSFAGNICSGVF